MLNLYDVAYGVGVGLAAPYWLLKPAARRKVLRAFGERMGQVPRREGDRPAVMIHAVSLGEMNATRALVQKLGAERPELQFIVSTTTDTGYEAGQKAYGANPNVTLIRYPLDFSSAVERVLDGLRPSVVALMELEVWPNFILRCQRRGVPVVLVNGRLTEGSFRNYRWGGALVRRMYSRLAAVCAQEETYAQRFRELGARPQCVSVTGTMKFDTAQITDSVAGAAELAAAVGLRPGQERIWVCGGTGPGEEAMALEQYGKLVEKYPDLRLVLVPRKPERFDEVAEMIAGAGFGVVRRSGKGESGQGDKETRRQGDKGTRGQGEGSDARAVILGDTMGELRKFYSLGDVLFVGRSLVDLGMRQHGSDMIEAGALGKPVIVGPFTTNFAEAMNCFRAAQAMVEVSSAGELKRAVEELLADPVKAKAMGQRAQEVVRREQGATQRHVKVILDQLNRNGGNRG